MKKKLLASMLIVLFLATGCGKVPTLKNGEEVVVSIEGKDISIDSLYKEMKDRYALSVLLDMIDEKILNDKYEDDEELKEINRNLGKTRLWKKLKKKITKIKESDCKVRW